MTQTELWLERNGAPLARRLTAAGALAIGGLVLVALSVGVALGRFGTYRLLPPAVIVGWLGAVAVVILGFAWVKRLQGHVRTDSLARQVELRSGLRHGSIGGMVDWPDTAGSFELAQLADRRSAGWLCEHGLAALRGERKKATRALRNGVAVLLAGAGAFIVSGPASRGASQFWSPLATLAGPSGPVELTVDRTEVQRGDSVRVLLEAPGRRNALLSVRAPGEPWDTRRVDLDSAGVAQLVLGPLDSDRFLTASSGRQWTDTLHVRVLFPLFLTDLQLLVRFPNYTGRPDEPLVPGPDSVALPVGTTVLTRGRLTLPVDPVEWRSGDARIRLATDGVAFAGNLIIRGTAYWALYVRTVQGPMLVDDPPALNIIAVRDAPPQITVPIPGADTTVPVSLLQPLVVDARDDYGLADAALLSWRVSRFGTASDSIVEQIPLPGPNTDRAVLQWMLDLNGRGFLPGDTARFKIRISDNAPTPQVGESRVYSLWFPSMAELRNDIRSRSRAVHEGADSLLEAQRELAQELEDLAATRERGEADEPGGTDELPFNSVEQAQELSDRQQEALDRAQQLREQLEGLSEAAWWGGITDPEFHSQLRDVAELLDRALTQELREKLEALRDAVENLDAERAREALRDLAQSAEQLRQELERGRELFERAAMEGQMSTLAEEADELSSRQEEWNEATATELSDSALGAREQALSARADSLAARLEELAQQLERSGDQGENLQESSQIAGEAAGEMQQAAQQVGTGDRAGARRSGESAEESLEPLAEELRRQRDELRESWRQEVLDAMDRALVETARLAQQQQQVTKRLNRGESGPDVRAAQAAVRSGVDKLLEQLQGAAGKNALVSPQLGTALGFSKVRMSESLDQLQRANPNTRQAGELAGEALDGLNAMAYALLRNRADVAGAESGSGLGEAMERLAEMAEQQGELAGQASGMLSLMPDAAQQILQELQALAQQQRSLADQLDQLRAEGEIGGMDELAEEARDVARELEATRLNRETVERQEQLFRRLLDAGRSLRSDEEDEREERVSEAANPGNVRLPGNVGLPTAAGLRFPYPTWEQLRSLTPDDRRLILDYFRRLNGGRP
ncbi:MAG: hypothetical protein P8X82_04755 [Gemmatimonadales bacterium]